MYQNKHSFLGYTVARTRKHAYCLMLYWHFSWQTWWLTGRNSYSVFGWSRGRLCTGGFHCFPQSFQENAGVLSSPLYCRIRPNFTNFVITIRPPIRRCMPYEAEKVQLNNLRNQPKPSCIFCLRFNLIGHMQLFRRFTHFASIGRQKSLNHDPICQWECGDVEPVLGVMTPCRSGL